VDDRRAGPGERSYSYTCFPFVYNPLRRDYYISSMTTREPKRPSAPINAASRRKTSPSMEQYIETIAHLLTKDKVCSVSDIAEIAQVSRPAASRAVRDLAEKDLVEHKAYGYVDLTPQGQSLADRLTARHHSLQRFLQEVMGYSAEVADEEACRLEHQLDDDLAGRMGELKRFFASAPAAAKAWRAHLERYLESADE
jgi:DtxR family transcriptional regulator, Mn-dependent transcriptional regulator